MPLVDLGDVRMHYHLHGCGEPLLMINGFCGDLYSWKRSIPLLDKKHQLIIFDNRGSGLTESSDGPFTMATLADDAASLIDALGLERTHVLGWSMGGNVAQELAIRHPQKVGALVLMSTYTKEPERSRFAIEAMINSVKEGGSIDTFHQMMQAWCSTEATFRGKENPAPNHPKEASSPHSIGGFQRQKKALDAFCSKGRLQTIKAPTLVVHGLEDIMVPPAFGEEVAAGIAGARFITVEKAGHFLPSGGYCPEVLEFLAKHPLNEGVAASVLSNCSAEQH
jgi:3-oxoadipate enol-lactonase